MSHELRFLNLWQQLTAKKAYNTDLNEQRRSFSYTCGIGDRVWTGNR